MSSSKLSDPEKQEIIELYQQMPEETTITLADRYGVSSSTVRRVLQSAIPKDTYERLTQQKQRLHRTGKRSTRNAEDAEETIFTATVEPDEDNDPPQEEEQFEEASPSSDSSPSLKRRRKRSSASENGESSESASSTTPTPKPIIKSSEDQPSNSYSSDPPGIGLMAEDFLREEFSEFEQEEDDNDEDEDEDYIEDDTDDEDEGEQFFSSSLSMARSALVKILPLTEAELPKTCYLVIDRSAELVAKPLKAFSELGQIPPDEVHEKTLPVFDNHRVASRFSARNQRVFKVPDTRLLQKAAPCLQAKGITRLLIDGQVYRF
ncbi:transcriptional regulator [Capilliphycus salinus ALCB114379]|uniref:transcriptional regulator n=1 Tax=Capilliphycus salinus TaxID=2768948 RepID=UPI0039A74548